MHRQLDEMIILAHTHHLHTYERPILQIEQLAGLFGHNFTSLGIPVFGSDVCKIDETQNRRLIVNDYSSGLAITHRECRSQTFMAPDDSLETCFQYSSVKRHGDTQGAGHIVQPMARRKLLQKPDALLRERQRHHVSRTRDRLNGSPITFLLAQLSELPGEV